MLQVLTKIDPQEGGAAPGKTARSESRRLVQPDKPPQVRIARDHPSCLSYQQLVMPPAHFVFILVFIGPLVFLDTAANIFLGKLARGGRTATNLPGAEVPDLATVTESVSIPKSIDTSTLGPLRPSAHALGPASRGREPAVNFHVAKQPHDRAISGRSSFWVPYPAPSRNRFFDYEEALKHRPTTASTSYQKSVRPPRRKSLTGWIRSIYPRKPSVGEKTVIESVALTDQTQLSPVVKLFKELCKKHLSEPESRMQVAREAVAYLLRNPNLRQEELDQWVKTLIKLGSNFNSNDGSTLEFRSTLLYGLHSLALKNYRSPSSKSLILSPLDQAMQNINIHGWHGQVVGEWERELFRPSSGLSRTLGTWSDLARLIQYEPSLSSLRMGLNNHMAGMTIQRAGVINHLEDLTPIFSITTMENYSAETRVASIALLSVIIHREGGLGFKNSQSVRFAQGLIAKDGKDVFLFQHEKTLLNGLTGG
ncbi:hypothetical protein MJO28_001735 [Puccinia striiformis f. sp. tritici]|uniref:Uncharacterized protein n=1 Tax=Puccinia striiformis f. sp. tritici TaxID=168172 RepID=A0ACC0EVG3_9BASI|nr:hypothetical protein MJO28_001735 [Puccinia striiformis f. sp. tritici]